MKPITPGKVPRPSGVYCLTDFREVMWASAPPSGVRPVLTRALELGHTVPHGFIALLFRRGGLSNVKNPFRQRPLHIPIEQPDDVLEIFACFLVKPVQVLRKARE